MSDRSYLEHFDGPYADFWREQARLYGHDQGHQRLIDLVAGLVPPGGLLLDCGMGNGFPFTFAWSRGLRVAGCDLSGKALGMARGELSGGAGSRLASGDLSALPFRDGAASTVVCARAIHYVPDFYSALSELWRVTASGGCLVLDCFNRAHPSRRRSLARLAFQFPWRLFRPAAGQQHSIRVPTVLAWLNSRGASTTLYDDQGLPMRDPEPWAQHPTVWIASRKS